MPSKNKDHHSQSFRPEAQFIEGEAEGLLGDVVAFLDSLRLEYGIGTRQYIDAHRLVMALARQRHLPADRSQLKGWLSPIVCSTAKQQQSFATAFHEWASSASELKVAPDAKPIKATPSARQYLLLALLLIGSAVGITYFYKKIVQSGPTSTGTLSGTVLENIGGTPITDARLLLLGKETTSNSQGAFAIGFVSQLASAELTVEHPQYPTRTIQVNLKESQPIIISLGKPIATGTPTPFAPSAPVEGSRWAKLRAFYRDHFFAVLGVVVIGPLSIFIIWYLAKRRQASLEKRELGEYSKLDQLLVKSSANVLYNEPEFRRTIQELRRHRQIISTDLEIKSTLDATVRLGGFPTPRYGLRQTSPEYLVLIDRVTNADQQSRLDSEFVNRLVNEGVYVAKYYFDGNPRVCYSEVGKPLLLDEIAARHPEHRLIIFADGSRFIHPVTGEPHRWVESLSKWINRVMLTPAPPENWGYTEWVLQNLDLIVLPMTKEGIGSLADFVNHNQTRHSLAGKPVRVYPPLLEDRPLRWLENQAPLKTTIKALGVQLRDYLPRAEFKWLCACAVYPMLYWELTLYLVCSLTKDLENIDRRLGALVRLPWFRQGRMPNWLRKELLSSLSHREEMQIRQAIQALLLTALDHPDDGVRLPYVNLGEQSQSERSDKTQRKRWRNLLRHAPRSSQLHEEVFLDFMTRDKLAIAVPKVLRQILYPNGVWWFRLRPQLGMALATAISVTLAVLLSTFVPQEVVPAVTFIPVPFPVPGNFNSADFSYSPSSGQQGHQYALRFTSLDCSKFELQDAKPAPSSESGVKVSSTSSDKCSMTANISVSSNAPLGDQTIPLMRSDRIGNFQFRVLSGGPSSICPTITISPSSLNFSPGRFAGPQGFSSDPVTANVIGGRATEPPAYVWSVSSKTSKPFIMHDGDPTVFIVDAGPLQPTYEVSVTVWGYDSSCQTTVRKTIRASMNAVASVTPTPDDVVIGFSIDYQFDDPVRGVRVWQRINPGTWVERYPNGVTTTFAVAGRSSINGNNGTVLTKIKGGMGDTDLESFQVFFANKGSQLMYAYFRQSPRDQWQPHGEMLNIKYGK